MICINCFHRSTAVTNSRPQKKHALIWRRRKCPQCEHTFTTEERPALRSSRQIFNPSNGKSMPFSIGRLTISIAAAFTHNPTLGKSHSFDLATTVEQHLATDYPQPSVDDIAAVTHTVLKRYDELAALQYAAQHGLVTNVRRRGRPSIS